MIEKQDGICSGRFQKSWNCFSVQFWMVSAVCVVFVASDWWGVDVMGIEAFRIALLVFFVIWAPGWAVLVGLTVHDLVRRRE